MNYIFPILTVLVTALPVIALLREIVFSIFVCNMGESIHRRKKANKIHMSQSFRKRVSYSYQEPYILKHRKAFLIYLRIAKIYVFSIFAALVALIAARNFFDGKQYVLIWSCLTLANCVLFLSLLFVARVGPDHKTRYDRNAKIG